MFRKIKEHYFTLDWLSFTFSWKTLRDVGIELEEEYMKRISIFDYFRFKFPEFESLLSDMIILKTGRFGYENALSFNNELMIMSTEKQLDDFGVFVTIPSHGLHVLAKIFNLPDFNQDFADTQKLFQVLLSRGAKITRIDICYDDYKKHLSPNDWSTLFSMGYIECRTRHVQSVTSSSGSTFYMGKRGKHRMLRIYDKCGESNGVIDAVRYEFELKNEYAYRFAVSVAEGQKFTFLDILDDFCKVHSEPVASVTLNENSKMTYELILSHYKRKVGDVLDKFGLLREDICNSSLNADCVPVLVPRVTHHYSFIKRRYWIQQYLSKALLKYVAVVGYDDLFEIIDKARDKLTNEDIAQIEHDISFNR